MHDIWHVLSTNRVLRAKDGIPCRTRLHPVHLGSAVLVLLFLVCVQGSQVEAGFVTGEDEGLRRQPLTLGGDCRKSIEPLVYWREVVSRYERDGVYAVADELRPWTWELYDACLGILSQTVHELVPPLGTHGWTLATVEAAAMLHTDLAVISGMRSTAESLHLKVARRLLALFDLLPEDYDTGFRREWYLAVGAYLHLQLRFEELAEHLQEAGRTHPEDSEIVLMTGMMTETMASTRFFRLWAVDEFKAGMVRPAPTRSGELDRAEHQYRTVLRLDPDSSEAHLRLGRVLHHLGRYDDALGELRLAARATDRPTVQYLAHLFSGAALEGAGRLDEAVLAYRDAVGVCPDGQASMFALSWALRRTGDQAAAMETVRRAVSMPADRRSEDPWLTYDLGRGPQYEEMLSGLRRRVRP